VASLGVKGLVGAMGIARFYAMGKIVIHWFRRDLRITDNTALHAASKASESVVPVYISSGWKNNHHWTGSNRQSFLCGSLSALDGNLRAVGSRLIIRQGDSVEELEKLVIKTGASAIFYNRDPDPFGRSVEERLAKTAMRLGIEIHAFKDIAIHERKEVLTGAGETFRVFTPYSKAWEKLPKPPIVGRIKQLSSPNISSLGLPTLASWDLPPAAGGVLESGEKAARERMREFLDRGLARYGANRFALWVDLDP